VVTVTPAANGQVVPVTVSVPRERAERTPMKAC
jgi:hypothetical protein